MLSERERLVLNDIERELDADDPELAERLAGAGQSAGRKGRPYWIAAAVIGLLLLISIGADAPIVTLVLAMAGSGVVAVGYFRSRKQTLG